MTDSRIDEICINYKPEINLIDLCETNDNNLLLAFHWYIISNNFGLGKIVSNSGLSQSTIQRILRFNLLKTKVAKDYLIRDIAYNTNINLEKISELEEIIKLYFICMCYMLIDNQNSLYKQILSYKEFYQNTAVEQLIYIIDFFQNGLEKNQVNENFAYFQKIEQFLPTWCKRILKCLYIMMDSIIENKSNVMNVLCEIDIKAEKDFWDELVYSFTPYLMRKVNDNVGELYYLKEQIDDRDASKIQLNISNLLFIVRLLIINGNYHEAKKTLNKIEENKDYIKSDLIINLMIQYYITIYFYEKRYDLVIEKAKEMKEIGDNFYTTYYLILYSYLMLIKFNEFGILLNHLKEITKPEFVVLKDSNLLFEKLVRMNRDEDIPVIYKRIKEHVKIQTRLGYGVVLHLLREQGYIK